MNKVLIIDDDTDIIKVVRKRLEEQDFVVSKVVTTFTEGLSYARDGEEPDFIILDLRLANFFGTDMLGILYSKWKKTKIYIFTAYPEYKEEYPFLEGIVYGIFSKMELEELIKTMKDESLKPTRVFRT